MCSKSDTPHRFPHSEILCESNSVVIGNIASGKASRFWRTDASKCFRGGGCVLTSWHSSCSGTEARVISDQDNELDPTLDVKITLI
jgi:hypothetical protein